MIKAASRRKFIKDITLTGMSLGIAAGTDLFAKPQQHAQKRIGIIGLDTSHSTEFTKLVNQAATGSPLSSYKIVAAYPQGSTTIESSYKRIPAYIEEVKKHGVKISSSIKELLDEVDVVMLETNDGKPRLQQALEVMKSGKPMFIDKPVAADLADVIAVYNAAEKYKVPVFSTSSLRYIDGATALRNGNSGKVTGADIYGPAYLEKSHTDLFWYGIHAVEILFTIMGTGCKQLSRTYSEQQEVITAVWNDNRIATLRGTRTGSYEYGGNVFTEKGTVALGKNPGYTPLLLEVFRFFDTGKSPVSTEETIAIYAYMEAADVSRKKGGKMVSIDEVLKKAKKKAAKISL